MQPGQVLNPDTEIVSTSGCFRFRYQGDGNLVLYQAGIAIWASNTAGRPAGVCIMRGDGNLVIHIPGGQPIWASNTKTAGSYLIVQDDGNVVIYAPSNQPLWATNTWVPSGPQATGDAMQPGQVLAVPSGPQATGNAMQPGQVLNPDTEIVSASGCFRFRYQSDGNLVLYQCGIAIWASNTAGNPPGVCIMKGYGNLVIYAEMGTLQNANRLVLPPPGGDPIWVPIWASNTKTVGSYLIVQDDGNVVIYAPSHQPLWATNTAAVRNLNVPLQYQQQTNWCWAAVSSMISHYYNQSSTWTQCAVATQIVNQWLQAHNYPSVNCCDAAVASTPACNVTWGLLPPLQLVGHFGSETGGVETLNGVYGQLNACCPVCIQIAWSGGGGHFLIIDGFDMDTQTIQVKDPAYGPGDYSYNTVVTDYQGSGTWVDTFLTIR